MDFVIPPLREPLDRNRRKLSSMAKRYHETPLTSRVSRPYCFPVGRKLTDEEKQKRLQRRINKLMKLPLEQLTAEQRRLTGRWDIENGCTEEELEMYFTKPTRAGGWYAHGKVRWSKQRSHPLERVPVHLRAQAEDRYNEYMARKVRRGVKITRQHVGSAWGCAVNFVLHIINGDYRRRVAWRDYRAFLWRRILRRRARAKAQAEIAQFQEKPLRERVRWGMS